MGTKMKTWIAAVLVLAGCASLAFARKWTDSTGKHAIEAELVESKDGNVRLKKEDGRLINIPLGHLSDADQNYVRSKAGRDKPHDSVTVWPAPPDEELSKDFSVKVNGKVSPVYVARVAPADRSSRAAGDIRYEKASFTTFDMQGKVKVLVTSSVPIVSAQVLPSSLKIVPKVFKKSLLLTLAEPKPLTIEVNGDWVHSLHIFANPPEEDAPRPDDPNVIYFGPGIHEVGHLEVGDGKTVYVAGGAVVRGVIQPDEPSWMVESTDHPGQFSRTYKAMIALCGKGITLRGRGILDGSRCPNLARHLLRVVKSSDIRIEGVVLRDCGIWNMPIGRSDRVTVENVKILGYRGYSDGIDIGSCRDVTVERCFVRTFDDLIVVKSGARKAERIVVRNCVLWNEVAHALSIGAEIQADVDSVLFTNCDVIHNKGAWALRVYHCDAARVSNVRFSDIRVEESRALISLWINKAVWSHDEDRGHINGVTFNRIFAQGGAMRVELEGFDATHLVENVAFHAVTRDGRPLTAAEVKCNDWVRNVKVTPTAEADVAMKVDPPQINPARASATGPASTVLPVSSLATRGGETAASKTASGPQPAAPPAAVAPFDAATAKKHQEAWAAHLGLPLQTENSIGMKLVLIPAGEFEMGSTPEEIAWALAEGTKNKEDSRYFGRVPSESPQHRVKISRPFYLGMYHVTQGEYEKLIGVNPSAFTGKQMEVSLFKPPLSEEEVKYRPEKCKLMAGKNTGRHPVETVSWDEALEFCRRLSAMPAEQAAGRVYRLPTEAEFEYACRAGTTTRWYCGDDEAGLVDVAWFGKNAARVTHPVGEKRPNAWGLYDMRGNVNQWCADWFGQDYYKQSPAADPGGPAAGVERVQRGGNCGSEASRCRSAFRSCFGPGGRSRLMGFRVVAEIRCEEKP